MVERNVVSFKKQSSAIFKVVIPTACWSHGLDGPGAPKIVMEALATV
jgi:hypothetical protein